MQGAFEIRPQEGLRAARQGRGWLVRIHEGYRRAVGLSLAVMVLVLLGACGTAETQDAAASGARVIQNKGSDTIVNLALAWAEAYRQVNPDLLIAVTGGGSGTGIAALINGTVDIANVSRQVKEDEIAAARANGIEPVEFVIAIDAIAVVVHPSNPVSKLTIDQLAAIFTGEITNWQEVGGNDESIVLLSRESNSGTHIYFLEEVIRKGDANSTAIFAPQTLLMPSSVGITSEVRRNPKAIGYDGLGYVDPAHEQIIAVARDAESPFVMPTVETGMDGSYPIARPLFMYTAGQPLAVVAEYLRWIQGPQGQQIVAELGFVPLQEQ